MAELPELKIDRLFNAPRELVWQAWTDPTLVQRWYGPGVDTTIHRFELQPGGLWLNEMHFSERSDYQKMEFQEVVPPEKLVWLHSSADANWNVTSSAMMPDWPQTLLTIVQFVVAEGATRVEFRQTPHNASDAEIACFAGAMAGMSGGWGKGFAIVDDILIELVGSS